MVSRLLCEHNMATQCIPDQLWFVAIIHDETLSYLHGDIDIVHIFYS